MVEPRSARERIGAEVSRNGRLAGHEDGVGRGRADETPAASGPHLKPLRTDADMNKVDSMTGLTGLTGVAGIVGIGFGLW